MKKAGRLLVIAGPTAVGKTGYSVHLAKRLNAAVISADSRQIYKEMKIGTARITEDEMKGVPHYMTGNISLKEDFDAGLYEARVIELLDELFQENEQVILAGGTGLYIKAVIEGLDKFPEVPREVRELREQEFSSIGLDNMLDELMKKDPWYYEKVDRSNPVRIIRAISVIDVSGEPFSKFLNQPKKPRDFDVRAAWLNLPKELLHGRINARVDEMLEDGLVEEVRELVRFREKQALQTVGYQEIFDFLDGKQSLEEARELIITHTRQYAKRQVTWFKKYIPGPELDARNRQELDAFFTKN